MENIKINKDVFKKQNKTAKLDKMNAWIFQCPQVRHYTFII